MRRVLVPLCYLTLLAGGSLLAPWLAPYGETVSDLDSVMSSPTAAHWLGTDALGRDVLSRLMFAGRPALAHAAIAVATMLTAGVCTGLVAGYLGGRADRVFRWVTDVMLAIPVLIVLLSVLSVTGHSLTITMIALGILLSPGLARLVRASALAVRGELYVAAARIAGVGHTRIMATHVLPRIAGPVLVQTSLACGGALLLDSGLSYLGFGPQPPAATWGSMLTDAAAVIDAHPWLLVPPGAVLGLAVLAFGLLGDALADASARRTAVVPAPPSILPSESPSHEALLTVHELSVAIPDERGWVTVADRVGLRIEPGETVGLVGESGCGKSVTAAALLGLVPGGGKAIGGRILLGDTDLTADSQPWQRIRGSRIGFVPQEPHTALDPSYTAGRQLAELVRHHHRRCDRATAWQRALELLDAVGLPDPPSAARKYPHQLSGGMAQRVAIAMALAGDPQLLIADEPTTALDAAARESVLRLLSGLSESRGLAILLISHDWEVVSGLCRRTYVMYAGQVVESGVTADLLGRPLHPYTAGLLASAPRNASRPRERLKAIPGSVPRPRDWPSGCHFAARCDLATAACTATATIPLTEPEPGRESRCVFGGVREPAAA